ncbi:MAG TPA: protein translocase subunit SecD, partial [Oligoflexia bacterium]|nr:protein translocase subunit SecD [Oligoflexia bacterium]
SSPVIRDEISGGNAQITGGFTREEAHRLAVVLRSGALPAPLTFEEERTVGATLGADAIRKGVTASLAGAALVVVFMIVYYRKAGLLAVGCVTLAVAFLLAVLSLFGATLTLPGIGGIALNVGMGVDASIIIYERIREELRTGATAKAAIEAGFSKAHWSIMDANITTLLSGLCLYSWGTGPIKGFAVTLCVGVLTTMFAALFVNRTGFHVLNMEDGNGKLSI